MEYRRVARLGAWLVLGLLAVGCRPQPAELVVVGGRIATMDPARPFATGVACRGGRLVAVGDEAEIRRLVGDGTEVVELAPGQLAVPGLIDDHAHFLSVGRARLQLDLAGMASWDEVVSAVAAEAARRQPGEWILGRGWHQDKWRRPPARQVAGMPVNDQLSAASPANPVLLTHASGHASIANRRALELAGIGDDTPDPAGGEIVRDPAGRATGVLLETAEGPVAQIASQGDEEPAVVRRAAEEASAVALAAGLTGFHDAGTTLAELAELRRMAEAGELPVRLWVMLSQDDAVLAPALPGAIVRRVGDGFLTVGGIKRYMDGALGSHGAWLLAPYADQPDSSGFNITSPQALAATAQLALANRLQLCTHAIGDRANREVLDVYQTALAGAEGGGRDRRWRIEHAQHLDPSDIPRFGELGVVASMQPVHCTSDGPWVPTRLGEQRASQGAYAWRSLLDSGAVVTAGTDAPVEALDTVPTLTAAVTRRMADGGRFHPEQAMTREEALRAMTRDAAWAVFDEDVAGTLEVGKYGDVTVLSQDILTVPEDRLAATTIVATIVGGVVRYRAR